MQKDVEAEVAEALKKLLCGEVIAYPTETFYALGVDPKNKQGINALQAIKSREVGVGISLIIDNGERLSEWIDTEDSFLRKRREELLQTFWPGPLTVVFKPSARLKQSFAEEILGPDGSVAVRVSSNLIATKLAAGLGGAITATSANPKGFPPPQTKVEVEKYFPDSFVIGEFPEKTLTATSSALPSTFLQITTWPFRIIREGAISKEQLAKWCSVDNDVRVTEF